MLPGSPTPLPKLGFPWAFLLSGWQASILCPLLGEHKEYVLRRRGPCILWRHEHIKLDERRGNHTHLSTQGVEAQVDDLQSWHGGQLFHRNICWEERGQVRGMGTSRVGRKMEWEDLEHTERLGPLTFVDHCEWTQLRGPIPL